MKKVAFAFIGLPFALAAPANENVITDWNQTAMAAMKAVNVGGNPSTRNLAMVHVAMSDPVKAVQGRYASYASPGPVKSGASAKAAAARS